MQGRTGVQRSGCQSPAYIPSSGQRFPRVIAHRCNDTNHPPLPRRPTDGLCCLLPKHWRNGHHRYTHQTQERTHQPTRHASPARNGEQTNVDLAISDTPSRNGRSANTHRHEPSLQAISPAGEVEHCTQPRSGVTHAILTKPDQATHRTRGLGQNTNQDPETFNRFAPNADNHSPTPRKKQAAVKRSSSRV